MALLFRCPPSLLPMALAARGSTAVGVCSVWLALCRESLGTWQAACWVLAHECGHNAFHPTGTVENAVGLVCHSLLLVPYFSGCASHAVSTHANCTISKSWRKTHASFPARNRRGDFQPLVSKGVLGESGLYGGRFCVVHSSRWPPLFDFWPFTGGPAQACAHLHFIPSPSQPRKPVSSFPGRWKAWCRCPTSAGLWCCSLMVFWAHANVAAAAACVYGLPYLVINAWLVCYTWLQHTDTYIPHFTADEWNWRRKPCQGPCDRSLWTVVEFSAPRYRSTHRGSPILSSPHSTTTPGVHWN